MTALEAYDISKTYYCSSEIKTIVMDSVFRKIIDAARSAEFYVSITVRSMIPISNPNSLVVDFYIQFIEKELLNRGYEIAVVSNHKVVEVRWNKPKIIGALSLT